MRYRRRGAADSPDFHSRRAPDPLGSARLSSAVLFLCGGASALLCSAARAEGAAPLLLVALLPLIYAVRRAGARGGVVLGLFLGLSWVLVNIESILAGPLAVAVSRSGLTLAVCMLFGMAAGSMRHRSSRTLWLLGVLWLGLEIALTAGGIGSPLRSVLAQAKGGLAHVALGLGWVALILVLVFSNVLVFITVEAIRRLARARGAVLTRSKENRDLLSTPEPARDCPFLTPLLRAPPPRAHIARIH